MSAQKIKELLTQIRELKSRSEEMAKLKGENFNIFTILKIEGAEATLHSTFLAELMNPEGSHGFGSIFLEDFIQRINKEFNLNLTEDFQVTGDGVKKEKYISSVDFLREEGGLLDIFIQTDKFVIGIENKIYSGDGHLQLERYGKFLNRFTESCSHQILLYLTLDGKENTSHSLKSNEDYFCISYQEFIIEWLEKCHTLVSDSPILRETIKQYIITIKLLTNQLTTHKMEKELENLLTKYYDEAQVIAANIGKIQNKRIIQLYGLIKSQLEKKLPAGWKMFFNLDTLTHDWHQIFFRKNWVDGLSISFEGTPKFINGFGHGILLSSENYDKKALKTKLAEKIKFSKRTNNWMIYNSGSYSKLAHKVNASTDLEKLAVEISDYMLQIIEKEKDTCDLLNQHLLSIQKTAEE